MKHCISCISGIFNKLILAIIAISAVPNANGSNCMCSDNEIITLNATINSDYNDTVTQQYTVNICTDDSIKLTEHIINIKNDTDDSIILIFNRDSTISDYSLVRNTFYSKPTDGMSLAEWLLESGDVDYSHLRISLFDSFIKIITPDTSFSLILINTDSARITPFIRCIPLSFVKSNFPALRLLFEMPNILRHPLFYQPDCIAIP